MANIIKNIIFWNYPRGSWQYDLFCFLLIISTIFFQPSFLKVPEHNQKDKKNTIKHSLTVNSEKENSLGISKIFLIKI